MIRMNLQEIQAQGITKVRLEKWANPDAYIELYRDEKGYGPWTTLYDEWGRHAFTEEEFRKLSKMLIWDAVTGEDWVEYKPKSEVKEV